MKRLPALLLALLLSCLLSAPAAGAEEEELTIEEVVEYVDLDAEETQPAPVSGDAAWTFPVALEDMNPEYIRLSNKHYLLSESYIPDLEKVPTLAKGGIKWRGKDTPKEGHRLQPAAVQALCDMTAEIRALAEEMGFRDMYLKSAYRSYRTQRTMYRNRLAKNNGKDDGWVSMPGASDHQTGLGLDIVPSNWKDRGMNDKMMKEPECQWMAEHCQEYGFIIRYPADKTATTEINTEPWHLRYVGIPVATYIMENGLCLEEFTWQLQEAIQDFISRGGSPDLVKDFIQTPTDENYVIPAL